jgi:PAS domain-containing protein
MKQVWTFKFWPSGAECFFGGVGLAVLTFICFRLKLTLATTGFAGPRPASARRKGTIVKWYGSSTDIEDRKRATEALRESEEQWREVFEHNPAMYFMVDPAGTVLSVNTFGAAQLGYTVSELVARAPSRY